MNPRIYRIIYDKYSCFVFSKIFQLFVTDVYFCASLLSSVLIAIFKADIIINAPYYILQVSTLGVSTFFVENISELQLSAMKLVTTVSELPILGT